MQMTATEAVAQIKSIVDEKLGLESAAREKLENCYRELRESVERFTRQNTFRGGASATAHDPGYKGFWPNAKMAEDFGALVMCCVSRDSAAREQYAERATKGGYTFRRADGKFAKAGDFVKDMGIGTDAAGGYLAPDEFARQIIRNVEEFSVFRANIRKAPMSASSQRWPKRTGGFTVYYPDEGKAITESDLSLGMVTLTAKKWAMITPVSQELEADAMIGIGELVATEFALALAQAEEANGFMGDGGSNYAGIVGVFGSPNVPVVTMDATKTAFSDLAPKNLISLVTAVPSWAKKADPAYYVHPEIAGIVMQMEDGNGRPIYTHPNEGFPGRVNGYPVRETSALPGLADSGVSKPFIAFGSLFLWGMLGMRQSLSVARSEEVRFFEDQVVLKAVARQDIQESDGLAMSILRTAAA